MRLTNCLKTLADETRLRLLGILARHELCVGELCEVLVMGQPRISRHLKILADSGLVRARRDGLYTFYAAESRGLGHELATALSPFLAAEELIAQDLARAERIKAERALATTRFFNSVAGRWAELSRELLDGLDLPRLLASLAPACDVAADLGCGPGELVAALKSKATLVIGVDSSSRMIEEARRARGEQGISWRIGQLEHLPLKDAEAQVATMSLVLHHLSAPLEGLIEARRVLAPGGTLIVAELGAHADEVLRGEHGDRWLGFNPETMLAWLDQAGLVQARTQARHIGRDLQLVIYTAHAPQT